LGNAYFILQQYDLAEKYWREEVLMNSDWRESALYALNLIDKRKASKKTIPLLTTSSAKKVEIKV
jgi:hypothetical protein